MCNDIAPSVSMSKRRDGQRRSPRISALDDVCKQNNQKSSRMKRKFDATAAATTTVSKLAKQVWKGRDNPQNEDDQKDPVEWRCGQNKKHGDPATANGKPTVLPARHILELVLDTLQRRDTYEIFAQPVDPDEVEDYYEIIQEPMDFGTMRAKLHEGLYENLEQFECDVFLIPENAIHFNSSGTIYYRQARAIHELATKVFDALKRDPESFVMEFSGTRRRSMRKALSDTRDSSRVPVSKPGIVRADVPCPKPPSAFRRTSKKNTGGRGEGRLAGCAVPDRRRTYWTKKGTVAPQRLQVYQGDISYNRYRESLMSFVKGLGPVAEMVAKRKLLGQHRLTSGQMRPQSQNYPEGTAAATERRTGDTHAAGAPSTDNNNNAAAAAAAFRTFSDYASVPDPFLRRKMMSNIIDLTEGVEGNGRNRRGVNDGGDQGKDKRTDHDAVPEKQKIGGTGTPVETATATARGVAVIPPNVDATRAKQGGGITINDRTHKIMRSRRMMMRGGRGCSPRSSSDIVAKYSRRRSTNSNTTNANFLSVGAAGRGKARSSDDNDLRPVILALENTHSSVAAAEYKKSSRINKRNCVVSPSERRRQGHQSQSQALNELPPMPKTATAFAAAAASVGSKKDEVSNSNLAETNKKQIMMMQLPPASQFTFDLPFLQAQLRQMKANKGETPNNSTSVSRHPEPVPLNPLIYSQSRPSPSSSSAFSKIDKNLVLQL